MRILSDEARGIGLGEAGTDHDVLDLPAQSLLLRQAAEHLPASWQRERDLVEREPRNLLDQIDLAVTSRARQVGTVTWCGGLASCPLEAEQLEGTKLRRRVDLEPDRARSPGRVGR